MGYAISSGAGTGNRRAGLGRATGSLASMTARPCPSSRSANSAVVIAATGATSPTMKPIRADGSAGSIGRYAAAGLEHCQDFSTQSPRRTAKTAAPQTAPGPPHARPTAAPTGSRLHRAPGRSSTGRCTDGHRISGVPATWVANIAGIDACSPAGRANTARLPNSSSRARSPTSSRSTDDNDRVGSAVTASNTRCSRSINVSDADRVEHVGAELHSPADPGVAGLGPVLTEREHQIHPGGLGVEWHRRDLQITQAHACGGVAGVSGGSSATPTSPAPADGASAIEPD